MIGRREPVERIERLLAAARHGRAGAIVIVGDAGVGKTSLLDHVDAGADGFQRLRMRGVESETALDHAGLLQLVTPVRHHLDAVPAPQRRALEAAVGWRPPEPSDDRYLVAAGTLSLLAVAAETMPVLVMVDDLHWLDVGSATAVLFAARRIAYDAVAILFATRHGSPPGTAIDGLERLTLNGLSTSDASGLLPGTAPDVVARLVTATRGNPLALIETAKRLTPAQRRGAAALPDPLPAGCRLEAVYEPVVASLSAAGRHAVMLAAASRDDAVEPVIAALRQHHDPDVGLGDAERRSVLVREPGVVRFRHPLLRTAAWAAATPLERRAAARRAGRGHAGQPSAGPDLAPRRGRHRTRRHAGGRPRGARQRGSGSVRPRRRLRRARACRPSVRRAHHRRRKARRGDRRRRHVRRRRPSPRPRRATPRQRRRQQGSRPSTRRARHPRAVRRFSAPGQTAARTGRRADRGTIARASALRARPNLLPPQRLRRTCQRRRAGDHARR